VPGCIYLIRSLNRVALGSISQHVGKWRANSIVVPVYQLQTGALGPIHTYHAVPLPRPCHSPTLTNAGRSPTCRFWTADANSHILCRSLGIPLPRTCRGLERSLSERHIRGMAGERHGMCESNTATLCKSNGKDTI
jgi:hypothetical protein